MQFAEFYEALYSNPDAKQKRSPFPWQKRLADRVIEHGWLANPGHASADEPLVLDLPTASGKTTTLDIAVFNLIHQLETGEARTAALRIFFIVDRRIVVDGTFRHARNLADKLENATGGPLKTAADLLRKHFQVEEDERPLHVSVMRGGMYRDDSWTRSPVQPTICISTVDQVGSRLLFRGYGVTPSMRPVHAGLVANDSLLLIDEAHLSEPFLQTLAEVGRLTRVANSEFDVQRPLQFVRMSATNAESETAPFTIDDDDRNHPVLSRRLEASKTTAFMKVSVDKENRLLADQQFAAETTNQAIALSGLGDLLEAQKRRNKRKQVDLEEPSWKPVRVIGVIVNRVRTARMIHEALVNTVRRSDGAKPLADVLLLTGRIRPFDRDDLLFRKDVNGKSGWLSWIAAGRDKDPERPVFVVATQTVEVGADISFDALVTEAAPLDCLRQRFGRLDRLGDRRTSRAVIVGRNISVAKTADDPVYGRAIGATWEWLNAIAEGTGKAKSVDFGLNAIEVHLKDLSPENLRELLAPKKNAPFLQRPYAEIWSRTNPAPAADPEIAAFLHGEDSGQADVQIIWRADLLNHAEESNGLKKRHEGDYINTVALVPPTRMEACSVPIWEARNLLARKPISGDLADVEGSTSHDSFTPSQTLALVWHGPNRQRPDDGLKSHLASADEINPGDTIILPSSVGGYDAFGWNPTCINPVADVAESCFRWSRGRSLLRVHPAVLNQWNIAATPASDEVRTIDDFLSGLASALDLPTAVRQSGADLAKRFSRRKPVPYELTADENDGMDSFVLVGRNRIEVDRIIGESQADVVIDEDETPQGDDSTSFLGQDHPISLDEHTSGVKKYAGLFSRLAGLTNHESDFELAALWHDLGKIDFRFQTMLNDGDEVETILAMSEGELRAKSGVPYTDRARRRRARRRAGVPDNFRHEALSVILLRHAARTQVLESAADRDLVEFLIGSHHGFGRPFFPVCVDEMPLDIDAEWHTESWQLTSAECSQQELFRIDSDWPELFSRLNRRYGIWGLAWLEAVFRLADHTQSSRESEKILEIQQIKATANV